MSEQRQALRSKKRDDAAQHKTRRHEIKVEAQLAMMEMQAEQANRVREHQLAMADKELQLMKARIQLSFAPPLTPHSIPSSSTMSPPSSQPISMPVEAPDPFSFMTAVPFEGLEAYPQPNFNIKD